MPIIIEMCLFLLVALAGYFGVNAAVDAATIKAQAATAGIRSIEEVQAAARVGYLMFAAGVGAMALARFISLKRGRGNLFSPFVLKINVDIGGFVPLFADEAFHEEVDAGGIDGSDAEAIADRGVGGGSAALAEDVFRPGEGDDIVDSQKISWIVQRFDQ